MNWITTTRKSGEHLRIAHGNTGQAVSTLLGLISSVYHCCIIICWFMQKYIYICWIHTDAMIKTQEDFFNKIFTSHFICKGSKRVTRGLRVWGSSRPNRNCNILTLTLMAVTSCLSRSPGLLNRRPWGPLCWALAFFTASYQHLLWTPTHQGLKAPSAWCGFPYHISFPTVCNSTGNWHLTSVLTALYNNSTPTRSPTWSLKSNV